MPAIATDSRPSSGAPFDDTATVVIDAALFALTAVTGLLDAVSYLGFGHV